MQVSKHISKLILVNLCCNALIAFQKAAEDNINCRLLESQHNLLLMQFWLWETFVEFIKIKPVTWSFMDIIMGPLFITSNYSVKKFIIGTSQKEYRVPFKMPKFLIYLELMQCPLIEIFAPYQSFADCTRPLQYWHQVFETFLWHFDVSFT